MRRPAGLLVDALPGLLLIALVVGLLAAAGVLPHGGGSASEEPGKDPAAAYAALFRSASARYPRVPAAQLAAQARAESGFDPSARSPVGAVGLMQVMPATFRSFAVDGDGDGRTEPRNAADSIFTAAHYLDYLGRTLGLRVSDPRVVAAYNAGPGAVRRYGGVPDYPETRAYVRRVTTWMPDYRWLDS